VTAAARAHGDVVGSYRLLAPLDSGGMGTVWLAEHVMLGHEVAVKFLLASVSQREDMVERFFDEARAATRIADPGIIAIHDVGWDDAGSAYIVMEYLVGETLAARVARLGCMPLDAALHVTRQIARTMHVAHACGIIHRDLKPDNVFVVPDPVAAGGERIKILDFGVAKLTGDEASLARTSSGMILGTPMYMSPEQCRGAGAVDHRTDIYALGCVLFHLLTGRPPFVGVGAGDLIASHLMVEPPVPSKLVAGIPRHVDALVARCLAKQADERYATMAELAQAIAAPPPRRSLAPLTIAALVACAAVVSAVLLWPRHAPEPRAPEPRAPARAIAPPPVDAAAPPPPAPPPLIVHPPPQQHRPSPPPPPPRLPDRSIDYDHR
jgi:eukaryotic-like serine/threonine-protein kinase